MTITVANGYIDCKGLEYPDGTQPFEWQFLEQTEITSSVSTVEFDIDQYSGTYNDIRLECYDITVETDGAELKVQFSTDNASTWDTTHTSYQERSSNYLTNTTAETNVYYATQNGIYGCFNIGNGFDEGAHFFMELYQPFNASAYCNIRSEGLYRQMYGAAGGGFFMCMAYPGAALTNIRLTSAVGTGGNMDGGRLMLYGRKLGIT